MSPLKTGLNAPFYNWLDEVRRAFRKEKELLEKLAYFNLMFIGYKGVNYGQVITNPMPRNDKDMLYWLDKIDETEKLLKKTQLKIFEYKTFLSKYKEDNIRIIEDFLLNSIPKNEFLLKNQISNYQYYKVVNAIARKWIDTKKYK